MADTAEQFGLISMTTFEEDKYEFIHLIPDHQKQIIGWRDTQFSFSKCKKKLCKSKLQQDYQKE